MSIELVMPFNHLILCLPLLFLPSIFPSIRVSSNDSALCISGQSTEASSASASVLPMMNIQDWFPLGLTVWFPCKNSQESSPAPQLKSINSLALSLLYGPTLTSVITTGKTVSLTIMTFNWQMMPLFFNTLSIFAIAFLPRSKCLLTSNFSLLFLNSPVSLKLSQNFKNLNKTESLTDLYMKNGGSY